ncbi:GNAT family N-acetyltransferase [bacterium]|nr:GNAT family N-acetyltransferase [bacterium]
MVYLEKDSLIIRDVDLTSSEKLNNFIKDVMSFMGDRVDPEIETAEAVNRAEQQGFCIEAVIENQRAGVLVINRGVFDNFQPKYHLAYIAVNKDFQGKGIGRVLLETACEITKNTIALHVGLNNKKAIEFYKKMGWKETYVRMMPEDWRE